MQATAIPTAAEAPVLPGTGVCDTHVHVFGPQARFPYVSDRRYTPDDATAEQYLAALTPLGVQRAVLTAPSTHGLDNSALLHGLSVGKDRFRGIVMVQENVDDAILAELHEAGVRGIRTQLKPASQKPLTVEELRRLSARIAPLGWHVEVHVDVGVITDIDALCAGFSTPVVIEHMGHMPTSQGVTHPGFQALLRFLESGGWAKLSGPYINSEAGAPYGDVAPYAAAILDAAPGRVVWGSNWPHPHQDPIPDDALLAQLVRQWIPDAARLHHVLVDAPAQLYDF